jgi:acyl-CoA synthetase (AMP-forming)/AMP-acid ligase II
VIGQAAERGEHPAFIDGATGEATSFGELAAQVDATAALLQDEGIGKGDVVALVGPNSAEWGIAYHAILRAGGVVIVSVGADLDIRRQGEIADEGDAAVAHNRVKAIRVGSE